ncbi:hypothetical protein TNCV_734561 [Trichonephila clavipes]|nr:hypothetical protein TNCV_734561 [Trichonephila clavipes]
MFGLNKHEIALLYESLNNDSLKSPLLIFGCKNGISSLKEKGASNRTHRRVGVDRRSELDKTKLKDLIVKSPDYVEEDVKVMIDSIVKDRIRTEEKEEKLRREQREYEEKL